MSSMLFPHKTRLISTEINRMAIYINLWKKLKFDMFNKEIEYVSASLRDGSC